MAQQLTLHPNLRARLEHGGDIRQGRRKERRPFDPKRALHVVMRSHRARGDWSLLHRRHRAQVMTAAYGLAKDSGIRLEGYSNVGNHLHFLLKAPDRAALQRFLRMFAGRIAMHVTRARKGRPAGRFWSATAYSRVVGHGREFLRVLAYLQKNRAEGLGIQRARLDELSWVPVELLGEHPPPV